MKLPNGLSYVAGHEYFNNVPLMSIRRAKLKRILGKMLYLISPHPTSLWRRLRERPLFADLTIHHSKVDGALVVI